MSAYERALRPLLFSLDPETAHACATTALYWAGRLPLAVRALELAFSHRDPALATTVAGLRFPNPVGLASGFDKDCRLAGVLPALGFGFVELGTVTLRPQSGDPRPRFFRVPEAGAIINRLGSNNAGAADAARRLGRLDPGKSLAPIGINLGLNADTPPEEAPRHYAETFTTLYPFGDYFVVNLGSPDARGLRALRRKLRLERILATLQQSNGERKPVFVKLSPDLDTEALSDLLPMIESNAAGVVCTNTTVQRSGLGLPERFESLRGGLSGAPIRDLSTRMIREVYRLTRGRLPIIGAGGVFSAEDAYQKIRAGASLVQLYTGLIYKGPALPGAVNRGLANLLKRHGLSDIADAVGRSDPGVRAGTARSGPAATQARP
ncbi:MAG: quinone-dependent dihydroorotate dehydrogenase [Elusimicrobiota bacterium]